MSNSLQPRELYVAHQAPLSLEFPRQEYWSGLPFPPPGDLPHPGMERVSPVSPALAGGFSTAEPPGKFMVALVLKKQKNKRKQATSPLTDG